MISKERKQNPWRRSLRLMHVCAPLRRLGRDFGVTLGLDLPIRGGTRLPMRDRDSRKRNQTCRHGALVLLDSWIQHYSDIKYNEQSIESCDAPSFGSACASVAVCQGIAARRHSNCHMVVCGECGVQRHTRSNSIYGCQYPLTRFQHHFGVRLGFRGFSVEIYTRGHVWHTVI